MNVNPKTPGTDKLGEASAQWAEVNALTLKQNGETVAPINSPAFTGSPTAPTPGSSDNSTKIATTAWVRDYAPQGNLAVLNTVGAAQIDAGAVGATQLASTGVTAGSYSLANITVDADGRITAAANGTAASGYTDEMAQDAVGAMLTATNSLTLSYNDSTPALSGTVNRKTSGLIAGSEGGVGDGSSGLYVILGTTGETAASGADARFPTTDQKAALAGTSGTPASGNKFVTDADTRIPTQSENDALVGTAGSPGSANKFVTDADTRIPTTDQAAAFAGTSGTPSGTNKFVTNADPRIPAQDENDALIGTSGTPSSSNKFVTDADTRLPSQGENDALAGTSGTPSATNKYVTHNDPRLVSTGNFTGDLTLGGNVSGSSAYITLTAGNSTRGPILNLEKIPLANITNASAQGKMLMRKSSGAGVYEETTLSEGLDLLLPGAGNGSIAYKGGSGWTLLNPGASGTWLKSNGNGSAPSWSQNTFYDEKFVSVASEEIVPATTTGCAVMATHEGATGKDYKYLAFDASTIERATFVIDFPADTVAASVKVKVCWGSATTVGNVVWELFLSALTDGVLLSTSGASGAATGAIVDASSALTWRETTAGPLALPTTDRRYVGYVQRTATSGSDTHEAADAWLFGLRFQFQRNGTSTIWP